MAIVRWHTQVLPVLCDEEMTVGKLREMCEQRLRIRPGCTRLLSKGTELQDSSTIAEVKTEERPEFILETRSKTPIAGSFDVSVKTLTGRSFPLTISAAMTVWDLKELISDHEGLFVDSVRLICAGHGLCDEETVEQLRMTVESVIYVVLRLR